MRKIFLATIIALLATAALGTAQAQTSATKQPIHGVVSMGKMTFLKDPAEPVNNSMSNAFDHPGIYSGMVVLGKWRDLEPSRGKFDFSTIDAGLQHIREYNAKYPKTPVLAKFRIIGAVASPDWVLKMGGGPITISHHDADHPIPVFWVPEYQAAWRELQAALAARYDNDPLVEEVAITSCTPNAGEPLLVPLSKENDPAILKAGYTNEAAHTCWEGAVDDYSAWKHVALDFTFNRARDIVDGKDVFNEAIVTQIMDDFRKRLGSRAVVANHGISEDIPTTLQTIEDQIQKLGGPIEFQTAHPHGDWDKMFAIEQKLGVTEMELWDGAGAGKNSPTVEQMKHWHDVLAATK